ncbi:mycofactocin-coupled SDR family oxidoreductase [Rhodococcus erythropolis]|uniref:mycofactocin-coupled SDR family oxidoreductase n=1 Tax=Rhodococcus erythropolis TaxID=1833 RepID=UPI0037FA1EEC
MDGKVVFITGAARGQGRAQAIRFAEEGASIVACDIADQIASVPYPMGTEDELQETASQIEKLNQRCVAVKADARNAADMTRLAQVAMTEFGRIDTLIVTHGISNGTGGWDASDEQFDDIIDVNLRGVWQACRAIIPHLIEGGRGGSIVLTSSVAGLQAFTGLVPAYVASNAGVIGLTRALSAELASHWIRVNALCPGTVDTPMIMNDNIMSLFAGKQTGGTREETEFAARALALLPAPFLEARDLANAALWLASDEARYVTGIAVPVDLGMSNQPAGIPPIAFQNLNSR